MHENIQNQKKISTDCGPINVGIFGDSVRLNSLKTLARLGQESVADHDTKYKLCGRLPQYAPAPAS